MEKRAEEEKCGRGKGEESEEGKEAAKVGALGNWCKVGNKHHTNN